MFGKKTLALFALIAIAGVIWVMREDSDADVARDLVRQKRRAETAEAVKEASNAQLPDAFKLSETLIAQRDSPSDIWTVSRGDDQSFVELPFPPPLDGVLPAKIDSSLSDASAPPVESDSEDTAPDESKGTTASQAISSANPGYLGAAACAECHPKKHGGFIETAHHRTSGLVEPGNIRGKFEGPGSRLQSGDPALSFDLFQRDDQLIQKLNFEDWQLEFPMDVFTGSAKTGQSMLYWHGDALFQAHVSYLSGSDSWITSPGYRDTSVVYSRVIRTACLECHMTFIDRKRTPNFYHRDSAIWGISCERCHGPGKDHVDHHRKNPKDKAGQFIVAPTSLPRQQQLEICGQCHSGSFKLMKDAFTFVPGNDLEDYHKLYDSGSSGVGGIHTANQLNRLSMSECFKQSEMTCTTCHNPHQNQHGRTDLFTQACFKCHEVEHCGMSSKLGPSIANDCIGCHMPTEANEDMKDVASGAFTIEMIDHYIRVPE
ncbi:MAG: multiheme c-type cytochrome [Planctomycetota bacterium]